MRRTRTIVSSPPKSQSTLIDINRLEKDLEATIEGEIRFGAGDRAMYASDAGNYRMVPIGVILPKSAEDVGQALRVCRSYGAPIVARGGPEIFYCSSFNLSAFIC